jgi:hypothetical protein
MEGAFLREETERLQEFDCSGRVSWTPALQVYEHAGTAKRFFSLTQSLIHVGCSLRFGLAASGKCSCVDSRSGGHSVNRLGMRRWGRTMGNACGVAVGFYADASFRFIAQMRPCYRQ